MKPHQCTQYTTADTRGKKSAVWHFQLIACYQVPFVFVHGGLHLKELGWTVIDFYFICCKKLQTISSILPLTLISALSIIASMQTGLNNKPAFLCKHQTWNSAFSKPLRGVVTTRQLHPLNTHHALQKVRYRVQTLWERQLRLCHSYFLLYCWRKTEPGPKRLCRAPFTHNC